MTFVTERPTALPEPDPAGRPRRQRPGRMRIVVRAAAVLGALALLFVGVTFGQVWKASTEDGVRPAEAIVVLGAAQYNGRPSPVLEARLRHALDLYRQEIAPLIVVTGGRQSGDTFTEATAGYNWLRARGVPDRNILKEVNGRNTWESLSAVARFLGERDVDSVILVSDSYHSLRVRDVAGEVGLQAEVSPPPDEGGSAGARITALVRETGAVSGGRLLGYRRLTSLLD